MKKEEWQSKGAGHRGRLRDKFLEYGIDALSDVEVVELLLTFGTPRSDCKEQARALLNRFGGLSAVLEAEEQDLLQIKGVGPKNIFALRFIPEISRRYLKKKINTKQFLSSSKDVRKYLQHSMSHLKKEVFTVIFLDSQHGIIDSEVVCEGTINVNTVYPREVVAKALSHNAAAIVIAHNHPSGSMKRSVQDDKLTKNLYLACRLMHIRLLDHIIIGDEVYSYADHGIMQEIKHDCEKMMQQEAK